MRLLHFIQKLLLFSNIFQLRRHYHTTFLNKLTQPNTFTISIAVCWVQAAASYFWTVCFNLLNIGKSRDWVAHWILFHATTKSIYKMRKKSCTSSSSTVASVWVSVILHWRWLQLCFCFVSSIWCEEESENVGPASVALKKYVWSWLFMLFVLLLPPLFLSHSLASFVNYYCHCCAHAHAHEFVLY